MKLYTPILTAAFVLCFFATTARGGIAGSAHDFSSSGWSKGQICLPCHAAHGGNGAGPLWNHQASTNTSATYSYTLYSADGVATTEDSKLDANSMLCMSCHDGTVALDSFGGVTGTTFMSVKGKVGGGGDLSGNHPIGTAGTYTTTDGINSTASYMVSPWILYGQKSATDTGRDSLKTASIGKLKALDGKYVVGCTTCHEPHNRNSKDHMLWVSNTGSITTNDGRAVAGSGLCLSCHKK